MVLMTVEIVLMKPFVNMIVRNICSSVIILEDVFLVLGNVMETKIVPMALMRMTTFAVSFIKYNWIFPSDL